MRHRVLLVLSVLLFLATVHAKILPDYIDVEACSKSNPEYAKCVLEGVFKVRPYFMRGIPEINFPTLEPMMVPYFTVNNKVNDLVEIKATLKNIKITGLNTTVIKEIKADPIKMTGEIKMEVPFSHMEMEYEVSGQLIIVPLQSKGFFTGNFTDTTLNIKGSLDKTIKDGEEYFKVKSLTVASRVSDGVVKLISKNPALQFADGLKGNHAEIPSGVNICDAKDRMKTQNVTKLYFQILADIITNFYNDNPKLVMDAINPIYVSSAADFFRIIFDKVLVNVPAKELLPE